MTVRRSRLPHPHSVLGGCRMERPTSVRLEAGSAEAEHHAELEFGMCLASLARDELSGVRPSRPSRPQQHPQVRASGTSRLASLAYVAAPEDGRTPFGSGCASVRNVQADSQDACREAKHILRPCHCAGSAVAAAIFFASARAGRVNG